MGSIGKNSGKDIKKDYSGGKMLGGGYGNVCCDDRRDIRYRMSYGRGLHM